MNTEELPSKSNLKPPIGAATMNVQMSAVGPHYGTVPCVRLPRREAQVCAPVVEPVAVDVVMVLWLADSSDYRSALWTVVSLLWPGLPEEPDLDAMVKALDALGNAER